MALSMGDLGSPFKTPKTKRISQLEFVSPSTPFRSRTPLGPKTMVASSSPAQASSPAPSHLHSVAPTRGVFSASSSSSASRHRPAAKFSDLPIELVQHIHIYSESTELPQVNRRMHEVLSRGGVNHKAKWALHTYANRRHRNMLDAILTRRFVTREVVEEVVRLWDRRRGYSRRASPADDDSNPSTPVRPSRPPLSATVIPRRLLRAANTGHRVHPMVRWLVDRFDIPIDADSSYPIQRASLDGNYELAEWLLARGASVTDRRMLAVQAAIKNRDLRMLKLLIERPPSGDQDGDPADKPPDRVVCRKEWVDFALEVGAKDIATWLVNEKQVMPSLKRLMRLGDP